MACNCRVVFSCISATSWIVSPSGCSSAWERRRSRRGQNLVSKTGGEPRGCCAWPRIPWHSGPRGMAHCHGAESRYQKTICEAVSKELHLESVVEQLCRQSDSWSGVGEETRDASDPPRQRKWSALSWHLTGLASLSSAEVTTASSIVTQRCFSECLLSHFVRFCGRLTKFLAELDANTLLLQHIPFTIWRRDKHDCTVDQLTHDWVKLPTAPLVCGVRRCCQVSYMVVTPILLVVSLFKKFFPDIFDLTSYRHVKMVPIIWICSV
jgi:hypothetical protein